jgi:Ca-activated chloride channel family protein
MPFMKYFKSRIFFRSILFAFLAFMCISTQSYAQYEKKTNFLFVLDCSGSMWGNMNGKQKIIVARRILTKMVDSLGNIPNVEMALRAYGNNSSGGIKDCKDTKLEVPFAADNGATIKAKLAKLNPSGTTPIAYSLTQAARDFPSTKSKNIIILITDGLEECGGDPCAVSQALQERGVMLKPFIIGLGMDEDYSKYFGCAGRYFSAESEEDFGKILSNVITQAMDNTTMQVNLNDSKGKPTETDVSMSFYDSHSGVLLNNYYHTMNAQGLPDTLKAEPFTKYSLVVHTTPPVTVNDIDIKPSKHNIINVNAAQGTMELFTRASEYKGLKCLVRKAGSQEIIYVQEFGTDHRYLIGAYDIEILSMPRVKISGVNIEQSKTNKVEIPGPGTLQVSYAKEMVASLYILRNNKQEWVADLKNEDKLEKVTYYLQPGSYKLVYRRQDSSQTEDSQEKDFTVTSGSNIGFNLE